MALRRSFSRNKYGSKKAMTAHGLFDSKGEAAWYHGLVLREMAGEISKLRRQVTFPIVINKFRVCDVVLDAVWEEGGVAQYADFKGVVTPEARLKFKLFEAKHFSRVRVFTAKGEIKLRRQGAPTKKKGRSRVNETGQSAAT